MYLGHETRSKSPITLQALSLCRHTSPAVKKKVLDTEGEEDAPRIPAQKRAKVESNVLTSHRSHGTFPE